MTILFSMAEHKARSGTGVGQAIRAAREARGLSLRAMAKELAVSPATVSAIERDLVPITVTRLDQVSRVLDVAAADLMAVSPSPRGPVRAEQLGSSGLDHPPQQVWRGFDRIVMDPVLQAATRLFVLQGFHATTVREIAAGAGMSVAGVYHHYPSKRHVLVAILNLTMSEISWRLDAARRDGRNPAESFALMVESLALFHAVRGDLAFLGASEMRGLGADRRRITAMRDEVQHALDRQAQQAMAARPSADRDVDGVRIATRAIATMCTSLPSWFKLGGQMSPREVARRYSDYGLALLGLDKSL
jgi:AcrR family transcriptional regulator/transcriptional regulator with XRE-family HTH domain